MKITVVIYLYLFQLYDFVKLKTKTHKNFYIDSIYEKF